ncbi:MAG: hypothetical protein KJO06_12990 [Gemmatimonadetes bacterium]|nr:hypothetical protein [Gemmatimonadota bacterium]NNK47489.1 hypothetical protein [Gemmatimonadota bacterium]
MTQPDTIAPVVDSIAIVTQNVFTDEEAENTGIFRFANKLRFKTREWVVERELLLKAGEPFDSSLAEETERNLRSLRLFAEARVDTATVDGKLLATVQTRDSWSTQPLFELSFATDGTVTGRLGLTETNVFGTGNYAHIAYRKDVDRDGLELRGELRRLAGTQLNVGGRYYNLSDGNFGSWFVGDPWRSFNDKRSIVYAGDAADRQAIQYRNESSAVRDTTRYWHENYAHRGIFGFATNATPRYFTRIGVLAEIRNQKYVLVQDTSQLVPDTVRAFVGVFGEYRRSEFRVLRFMNGFAREDIDLSATVSLGLNIAPESFGYERFGLGPSMLMQAGGSLGEGFVHGRLSANGLFNAAGLDSGRVNLAVTVGQKLARKHATVLHARAGLMENPPPSGEFDLGFDFPPRSWEPHSFVGTRSVWGTLEHRWWALENILNLFGLGFVGFVDYGGAWYEDQSPRWGGAAGIGIRTGSSRGSASDTGRIDLGYRFGPDVTGSRWVISFGSGWAFP